MYHLGYFVKVMNCGVIPIFCFVSIVECCVAKHSFLHLVANSIANK
jgi:hypothetical protein